MSTSFSLTANTGRKKPSLRCINKDLIASEHSLVSAFSEFALNRSLSFTQCQGNTYCRSVAAPLFSSSQV